MKKLFLILFVLLFSVNLFAVSNGSVQGQVKDGSTGETIPFANVVLEGTVYGAAADLDGNYIIKDIAPGEYIIKASSMGYEDQEETVVIKPLEVTVVDFSLPERILTGAEVVVKAERELIQVDVTSSQHEMDESDLAEININTVDEAVKNQAGVVESEENELHVRGGRAGEVAMIVDGLSIQDPLNGSTKTFYLPQSVISKVEVITGGYNAEYGQAMSGVVRTETIDGTDFYTGELSFESDNFGFKEYEDMFQGSFTLSGPEPVNSVLKSVGVKLPGDFNFVMNANGMFTNTYLPYSKNVESDLFGEFFSPRADNSWSALYKTSWKVTDNAKISFSYKGSLKINQGYFEPGFYSSSPSGYPIEFGVRTIEYENEDGDTVSVTYDRLDNYNTFTIEGNQQNLQYNQVFSPQFYMDVVLGRTFSHSRSQVGKKHWTEYVPEQDLNDDGFVDLGDANTWHDRYAETYSLKSNFTWLPTNNHTLKFGLGHDMTTMQVIDIYKPNVGDENGLNHDFYTAKPASGFFYAQDKITFEGLIVNIGIRFDYWFVSSYVENAMEDPETYNINEYAREKFYEETFTLFGYRGKGNISPRLGISYPISSKDLLFISYGHFSQKPKYQYVFAKLDTRSLSTYQMFGNPNLTQTNNVAFELGLKHKFTDNFVLTVTTFYKDIFGYPTSMKVYPDNFRLANNSFLMYFNQDFARSRGLELSWEKRTTNRWGLRGSFTYSISTGKSSNPNDAQLVAQGHLSEQSIDEDYLKWDKPFVFKNSFIWRIENGEHPELFGLKLPDDWGFTFSYSISSGKRYTPKYIIGIDDYGVQTEEDGDRYSESSKAWQIADLYLYKNFSLGKKTDFKMYIEINNMFNNRNSKIINPITGRAYEEGDPVPNSWNPEYDSDAEPLDNPARFSAPRQIVWGISLSW